MITIYNLNLEKKSISIENIELYKNIAISMNEEDIIKALQLNLYTKVAEIETNELEDAYTKMTNLYEHWNTQLDITEFSNDNRYSDIGDLALLNNKLYYVTHLGFKPLPDEKIDLLPQEKAKLKL